MNIIKTEIYKVDNISFSTEKEAQDYLDKRDGIKTVQEYNLQLLDSIGEPFVPIYDADEMEIDIFVNVKVKNGGSWNVWQSLRKDNELRYYTEKLNVISADEFMERFKNHPEIYLGTNEWNSFLCGITYLNDKANNPIDWKEVVGLLGRMQVTPEVIYN